MTNWPQVSWDETAPAGSQAISLGDDRIRELKTQIREIIDVDHDFPSSGQAADNGQHKQVTLQEQADLGTGAAGATILGSQTVSGKGELVYTDEDDNDIQITSGGNIKAESIAGVYPAANVAALATIMNLIYPIGFVVTLGVSTNPGTLFGVGTWTAIAGRVIFGIDAGQAEFDTLNETGGAKTVAHTHSVTVPISGYGVAGVSPGTVDSGRMVVGSGSAESGETLESLRAAGAAQAVTSGAASDTNNLPNYIVKYVWERTA